MALLEDTVSNAEANNVSSVSWSHTCTGSERALFVHGGGWDASGFDISAVTYNAVALTQVGQSALSSGNDRCEIWRLIAPATGANTIAVTFASAGHFGVIGGYSVTGCDQTTPEGTFASATGSSTTPSVTVSSASDEIVIDALAHDGTNHTTTTMTADSGRTESFNTEVAGPSGEIAAGSRDVSPAGSEAMDWTLDGSASPWAMAGVSIKPASGAPQGGVPLRTLLGVGT